MSRSSAPPSDPPSADRSFRSKPGGPGRRRRRWASMVALGAVGALAAIGGLVAGGGPEEAGRSGLGRAGSSLAPVDRLTLEQRVGQTLLLSFRGTDAPAYVLELLRKRRVAGVVLFAENVASRPQLRGLTRDLQRAARGRALIATDQEGGAIRQIPWAAPGEGQAAQATHEEASASAQDAAADLRRVGVNVNLAPIADVAAAEGSAVGGRAYPGSSGQVADLTRAAVEAYLRAGVAPAPKHFPGFGAARANTDDKPVTIAAPRGELLARDLEPFRAAVAAHAPLVMASHALYPALDRARIASQSPVVLDDLLRRRLGFGGVVITDSIEAEAVLRRSSVAGAGARAVLAGADLVLMTGPGSYAPVYRRLLTEARRSRRFSGRVAESAGRVLALAETVGRGPPVGPSSRR